MVNQVKASWSSALSRQGELKMSEVMASCRDLSSLSVKVKSNQVMSYNGIA